MLTTIIAWIVLGALAGWIATMLTGTDTEVNGFTNVIVGVIGAFIGGFIVRLFGGPGASGFDLPSLLVAVLGAVVLLSALKVMRRDRI